MKVESCFMLHAFSSMQVFIHTPGGLNKSGADTASADVPSSEVNVLNINQAIKCLAAGKLDPSSDRDFLFIGTQTHIQVYDVYNNADVLFQQVSCFLSPSLFRTRRPQCTGVFSAFFKNQMEARFEPTIYCLIGGCTIN